MLIPSSIVRLCGAAVLLLGVPIAAQVRLGELSAQMTGTIAPGYSATYGNQTASSHAWTVGGAGNLSGSYYNPNFLSFNIGYYLNQSRSNSNFQSITNASGLDATSTIFGGSSFPGGVNYSKAYNSEGNYSIPGVANYVTHGNSDTFGVNWSENLPNAPSFSAGFQMGNSQYSVYGTNDTGNNKFHSMNLRSSYHLDGFNLGAYYSNGSAHSLIPQVIAGESLDQTRTASSSYGFNVSHILPLHGSMSGGFNRSHWDSNYLGTESTGDVDLLSMNAGVHLRPNVSLNGSASYSDNLSGQLIESVVGASSSAASILDSHESSHSLDLIAVLGYNPSDSLQTSISAERRSQTFLGQNYGSNSYGASASYVHRLFDGNLNSSLSLNDNSSDSNDSNSLGFTSTENYSTKALGWTFNGSFSYAQNVQTLLVTYMNSYLNYSLSARRNWGKFNVSGAAAASHTAITDQPGTSNASESFSGSVGFGPMATFAGSYSKASGQALVTGSGLVVVPVPSPVLPSSVIDLFGGDSYSMSFSSSPVKKLILNASYARSASNTTTGTTLSANQNEQFSSLVQYQFRKLEFTSGYARLEQGFSGSSTPPQVVSSFYIGASRWFKFF